MTESMPVTELVLLHLKPGINLDDVWAGRESDNDASATLIKLGRTLGEQKGCIRQFWGQHIEKPNIFVWTTDWEAFDDHAAYMNAEGYKDFIANAAKVFDFEAAKPLMSHTAFTSEATAAREAPCTEVAYFMLPKEADEEQKAKLEDTWLPGIKAATTTVGTATTFAVGWIFEEQPHPQAPSGQAICLNAFVGWPSVEDHDKFRTTPEFFDVIGQVKALALPATQDRTLFHVNFHPIV